MDFCLQFFIAFGVGAGGIHDFHDNCMNNGEKKPWLNGQPKVKTFQKTIYLNQKTGFFNFIKILNHRNVKDALHINLNVFGIVYKIQP